MKKSIKLLLLTIVFISSLSGSTIEQKIVEFEKQRFSKNKRIEIQNISISMKKALPTKGWYGFIVDIEALMAKDIVKAKDIVFSDGTLVSSELFDINTSKSYKDLMTPVLPSNYYDKSKLIAGNHNAEDKIVVFSDPLCPFCMDLVPDVIKHVKENSKSIALYYYHFPLIRLHPAALSLSKLIILGKQNGIEDIELKVYTTDWDKHFSSKEKSEEKILDGFNKEFNTKFTKEQLSNVEVQKEIATDINKGEDVMVQGTPTIFINGEQDKTKLKYEMLGK